MLNIPQTLPSENQNRSHLEVLIPQRRALHNRHLPIPRTQHCPISHNGTQPHRIRTHPITGEETMLLNLSRALHQAHHLHGMASAGGAGGGG